MLAIDGFAAAAEADLASCLGEVEMGCHAVADIVIKLASFDELER